MVCCDECKFGWFEINSCGTQQIGRHKGKINTGSGIFEEKYTGRCKLRDVHITRNTKCTMFTDKD